MKKRFVSLVIVVCLLLAIPFAPLQASQMPCFTGVNDTLLPLKDATMPAYFGTKLYVPVSVFTEFGISSGTSASQGILSVYRSSEKLRLDFFISLGLVMDQDGETYEGAGVEIIDGLYFVPLEFMCGFFNLTYTLLSNDPLSVLRIKNSSAVYNDRTYLGTYKRQIENAYKAYTTPATQTPNPSSVTPTESPIILDFSDVTVYLSFFNAGDSYTPTILDTLASYSTSACFFLSSSDIMANPALVRRISGEKHMLGIWLDSADYEEYVYTSYLLFEAGKLVTPLVATNAELAEEVSAMCEEYGLIYRPATVQPDDEMGSATVTALVSITPHTTDDLRFACTQNTSRILPQVVRYLENLKYSVTVITETSAGV